MFGDIRSDEAAGRLGMAPGLCIGEGNIAMAQATHGSAPDIAGKGLANPYAIMESTRMLLAWLGHNRGIGQAVRAASILERVLTRALADRTRRTPGIKDMGNTQTMMRAVADAIEEERADVDA
jgi:3-isopropylmalate dehydrogenase